MMHVPYDIKKYAIGKVVVYKSMGEAERLTEHEIKMKIHADGIVEDIGHIVGFSVNNTNEVLLVVEWAGNYSENLNFPSKRAIHPSYVVLLDA